VKDIKIEKSSGLGFAEERESFTNKNISVD
jgi:hypothetical protein